MGKIFFALGAIAIVAFVLMIGPGVQERQADHNQYMERRERLDLYSRELDLERKEALQGINIAAAASMTTLGVVIAFVIGAIVVYWGGKRAHATVTPLVKPDKMGRLPVSREALTQGDYDRVVHRVYELLAVAEVERAVHQPGQTPHSYSPKIDVKPARETPTIIDAVPTQNTDVTVPTFHELLQTNQIGPSATGQRQPIILAYGDEGAITGDWRMIYSTGLGGLQGSGKTWTAAYLITQSALNGAKLVICDPHAEDDESLATRVAPLKSAFLCDIADDEQSIIDALSLADDVLQRRKKGNPDRTPLIVAVDEWTALRRGKLAEKLPKIIEDFSTEGRKLQCHVMLLGQRWDKQSVGDFRNTLASSFVHRMRSEEARMMTGLRANTLPDDTLQLPPGTCYLLDTYGHLRRARIPHITSHDIAQAAQHIGEPAQIDETKTRFHMGFKPPTSAAARNPDETQMKPKVETHETSSPSPGTPQEESRILSLFFEQGLTIGQIVKQLWGEISGPKYNHRRDYVESVIRTKHLRGT